MLNHTTKPGTGESYCLTPAWERVQFQNTAISQNTATAFLYFLVKGKGLTFFKETVVVFSERVCKNRWGTAWSSRNEIVLYRHDVQTFLHELAHIPYGNEHGHNAVFARFLDALIAIWKSPAWTEFRNQLGC